MSVWRKVTGWSIFTIAAICLQALMPGIDVMAVGVLILMDEKDYKGLLWLLPLFILLQEGMGSRPFGALIIWYAAIIALFKLGQWFFNARNFLFMFLLSACLGCAYYVLEWLMAMLQDVPFNVPDCLDKSLTQAIFMPFAWSMLIAFRKKPAEKEEDE